MKKNGFSPKEITYGWYIHNEKSRRCEKKFNIRFFNSRFAFDLHDYELDNLYSPMMIIQNIRGMLR